MHPRCSLHRPIRNDQGIGSVPGARSVGRARADRVIATIQLDVCERHASGVDTSAV